MYTIGVNTYAKVFSVVMKGNITEEDSRTFAAELQNKVNTIVPSDYALLVDTRDLPETMRPNGSELLRKSLISAIPFKTKYHFTPVQVND
jgi:hypothetical protein